MINKWNKKIKMKKALLIAFLLFCSILATSVNARIKPPESIRKQVVDVVKEYVTVPFSFKLDTNFFLNKKNLMKKLPSSFTATELENIIMFSQPENYLAEIKGLYFLEKNKVIGYFLMERITITGFDNTDVLMQYIQSHPKNQNYLSGLLNIPDDVNIDLYEQELNGYVKRFAVINGDTLGYEAYYPLINDSQINEIAANYLNELMILLSPSLSPLNN